MQCHDICNDTLVSEAAFGMYYLAHARHHDIIFPGAGQKNLPANLHLSCLGVFLLAALERETPGYRYQF
jgi:hypothetical protein